MIAERIRRSFQGAPRLSTASNPAQWFIDWIRPNPTASGIHVDEYAALNYSAVWAATCFYTAAFATLPMVLYRELADDDRERAKTHPLYPLLKDQPNDEQDNVMFWSMQGPCLVNWGNCYAEKEYTFGGNLYALWPIHARQVTPYRDGEGGPLRYEVTSESGSKRYIDRKDMFHIAGWISDDGVMGKGVIRQARESIGMGLATEKFGSAFFGNDCTPGLAITHPQNPSEEAEKNIRRGWEKRHKGAGNAHQIAFLREGMKVERIGIPPEEAQFLETRQHNITEIARWYNLPPHILSDLLRATFSNIEQQDLNLLKHSLRPWLVRIEKSAKRQLIGARDSSLYWEYLVDALLRADAQARTEAAYKQFMNGALTLNEWRRMENRNRIPDKYGDQHFVPNNLIPIDMIGEEPSQPKQPKQPEEGNGVGGDDNDPGSEPVLSAIKDVIREVGERMGRIEANEIRRAVKSPEKFIDRLEAFFSSHEEVVKAALLSCVAAMLMASGDATKPERAAAEIAKNRTDALRARVLEIAEAKPAELVAKAEEVLGRKLTMTFHGTEI